MAIVHGSCPFFLLFLWFLLMLCIIFIQSFFFVVRFFRIISALLSFIFVLYNQTFPLMFGHVYCSCIYQNFSSSSSSYYSVYCHQFIDPCLVSIERFHSMAPFLLKLFILSILSTLIYKYSFFDIINNQTNKQKISSSIETKTKA